jgi:hypothetical protein
MNRRTLAALFVVLCTSLALAGGRNQARLIERLKRHAAVEQDVMVAMRDGVRLATDILRPKGEGAHPVVLMRTPYRKRIAGGLGVVRQGYAFVVQDCRGRYGSEGEFYPFIHDLEDGADTIAWFKEQAWCNGKIGMMGGSYVGFTQLAAALTDPPGLRCIMPIVPPSDFEHGTLFFGGALRQELAQGWLLGQAWLSQRVRSGKVPAEELARWRPQRSFRKWCWHLPLREAGPIAIGGESYAEAWGDIIEHWEDPGHWQKPSAALRPEAVKVPVLITAGFYDIFAQENIDLFLALRARGGSELARRHSHLLIGPWVHGVGRKAGDVDFPKARGILAGLNQKWLGRWLKDEQTGVDGWPPIYAFVMGQDRWLAADTWPPKQSSPKKLYLAESGLAWEPPAEGAPSSSFVYDPEDPVPTTGGGNLLLPKGIRDHRKLADRPDVLAFLSEPLERDFVVVGRLRAHLFVSTTARDTDFTAMLLDVLPDGTRRNVQDGIVRLRYREGRGEPQLVTPGQAVEVDIDLWSTAYAFKVGHRIALHVSSSNFPRFDRHLNRAEFPGDWTDPEKATNTVYHELDRASFIELSILP